MKMVPTRLENDLRALCQLSGVAEPIDFRHLTNMVQGSPDPETAVRSVLGHVPSASELLARKWRNVITDMWALKHPHVPILPELKLAADEVTQAPVLADAKAVLEALEKRPATILQENDEWLVTPEDTEYFLSLMPSQQELPQYPIENEWNAMSFRRLRAILHAARLIRPMKGKIVPVRSRLERFRSLPDPQQLFVLWHADAYHVYWGDFAGIWGAYMQIVQEYLPLAWEGMEEIEVGGIHERSELAGHIMETFLPLWEDERLLDIRPGHTAALSIVQQQALPTIIDRFFLRDLLVRHGLATVSEDFGSISKFVWTAVGVNLLQAEAGLQLPCGNDLLDR